MTAEQLKANAEYYRKLNQQLIQKDNIIKLLQLKLKNLETNLTGPGGTVTELPGDDDDRKGKGPRKLRTDSDDKVRELSARIAELERSNERLSNDLTTSQEEIARLETLRVDEKALAEAKAQEPPRPQSVVDMSAHNREVERLRLQIAEKSRELDRAKDEVERQKSAERWPAGADPILKEDLTRAERDLAAARSENDRLKEQIEMLQNRPEPAVSLAPPPSGDQMALMQMVIGLLQKANELEPHMPNTADSTVRAFRAQLTEIAKSAGIQRTRTIGAAFDPKLHQAIETVYSSEHPHSTVLQELSPGFSAQGAVVRLADVVVSLNPYYCASCDKVAVEGSRFCHVCGSRVLGREKEGVRILDERATCLSQIELASSHEIAGNLGLATVHYNKALTVDPKNARALSGMARVAEAEGRYDEALRFLDEVLPLDPESPDLHRAKERILVKLEILAKLRSLT